MSWQKPYSARATPYSPFKQPDQATIRAVMAAMSQQAPPPPGPYGASPPTVSLAMQLALDTMRDTILEEVTKRLEILLEHITEVVEGLNEEEDDDMSVVDESETAGEAEADCCTQPADEPSSPAPRALKKRCRFIDDEATQAE